ncbi:MAG: GNAT family N-acetyltransferase [Phycisphaerales bacterium JB065]
MCTPNPAQPRFTIRPLTGMDDPCAERWRTLRDELFETTDDADSLLETREILTDGSTRGMSYAVFLAVDLHRPDAILGFVEVALRRFAEGCRTDPVGFIEGWMVLESARGHGIGGALVARAEDWAREHGCTEMASDAELENHPSDAAHRALGYREVARIRCFAKDL